MFSVIQFVRVGVLSLLLSVASNAAAVGQAQQRIAVQDGQFVVEQTGGEFRPYVANMLDGLEQPAGTAYM
jgi:hypothetical protein